MNQLVNSCTENSPFHALALTGGGYRGLFTAQALRVIEDSIQEPIGRRFDLVTGTSIGGIVALSVAYEIPMSRVVEVFEKYGQSIFPYEKPPSNRCTKALDVVKHFKKPKYSVEPLREAILSLIDENLTLNDVLHPVAIPAVNITQGTPQVFKSRHKEEWVRDSKYKAVDIALATSAAPTFFELAEVDGSLYADGGLFANAPDLIAIHEAEHYFKVSIESIKLLSIGTTTKSYSVSFDAGRKFGILDWMEDSRMFSVMISSQQQYVDSITSHRLGSNYLRIDHEPSQEQSNDLGLDRASYTARQTLKALATKATTDALGKNLKSFLNHTPHLKVIRN